MDPSHRRPVLLSKLTRREVRQALETGEIKAAIIPTGSIEQHLEHLALEHDIASATAVAVAAAERLYPSVLVATPMSIGISEHHMFAPGTLTAKPGSWLAVLFDAVESLIRHGIKKVVILNGHAGNVRPVQGVLDQWNLYFQREHPSSQVVFYSYWDLIPKDFALQVLESGRYPGHAQEFETAIALYAFPENVRVKAVADQEDHEPSLANPEKGEILFGKAVDGVVKCLTELIEAGQEG
ncbi:MAG: creatininase family protein [Armatimonadetes bacterium]|nr:creatininase family protein [Armatimonadota bacterium]MDW8121726.1 creatininase family protein [Armatimonadota bacterium]